MYLSMWVQTRLHVGADKTAWANFEELESSCDCTWVAAIIARAGHGDACNAGLNVLLQSWCGTALPTACATQRR